jgi:hypothetical protein
MIKPGSRYNVTGPKYAALANAVSDAIAEAQKAGLRIDEAVCIVAGVAADYARGEYGDAYLTLLAEVVSDQAGKPLPKDIGGQ